MTITDNIVARWTSEGVANAGASLEQVHAFELAHGVELPAPLRELLLLADGMPLDHADSRMIRFLSVEEIGPAKTVMPELAGDVSHSLYVFAEFAMWSHGYATQFTTSAGVSQVVALGGPEPLVVAFSLEDFLEKYEDRPSEILAVT